VRRGLLAAAAVALGLAARGASAADEQPPPDPAVLAKVEQALPAQARAKPSRPRRLLIFNLHRGHWGPAKIAAKTFESMGRRTGAFEVEATDDPACFDRRALDRFDAVCLNNCNGAWDWFRADGGGDAAEAEAAAARRKSDFLAWLQGGKGVVGVHGAADAPHAAELFGARYAGHPWAARDRVALRVDDPGHALARAFPDKALEIEEEIYVFRRPEDRDLRARARVLLSLDPGRTDMDRPGVPQDRDCPVAWIRPRGAGRVFYCSLGHNQAVYWNPAVLRFYLDGIQFALGDLPADAGAGAK
jgi:type 1 glutamine amidotransferase